MGRKVGGRIAEELKHIQLLLSREPPGLGREKTKPEDPLGTTPTVQSNLTNREIRRQKTEGRGLRRYHPASVCSSIKWARCPPCYLSGGRTAQERGSPRAVRCILPHDDSTTYQCQHPLCRDTRTESQTCNKPKMVHKCTNGLEFSLIFWGGFNLSQSFSSKNKWPCFLKVSFSFFKHFNEKNISEPQRELTFSLCVICIAGTFRIYIFGGPTG